MFSDSLLMVFGCIAMVFYVHVNTYIHRHYYSQAFKEFEQHFAKLNGREDKNRGDHHENKSSGKEEESDEDTDDSSEEEYEYSTSAGHYQSMIPTYKGHDFLNTRIADLDMEDVPGLGPKNIERLVRNHNITHPLNLLSLYHQYEGKDDALMEHLGIRFPNASTQRDFITALEEKWKVIKEH